MNATNRKNTDDGHPSAAWAQLQRHGWYAHYVPPQTAADWHINAHTHGFPTRTGHRDFQIVMPVTPEHAHMLFDTLFERVQQGHVFKAGDVIPDLIVDNDGNDRPVRIIDARENGRNVLRLIFPDKHWLFPGDAGVDSQCAAQLTVDTE